MLFTESPRLFRKGRASRREAIVAERRLSPFCGISKIDENCKKNKKLPLILIANKKLEHEKNY